MCRSSRRRPGWRGDSWFKSNRRGRRGLQQRTHRGHRGLKQRNRRGRRDAEDDLGLATTASVASRATLRCGFEFLNSFSQQQKRKEGRKKKKERKKERTFLFFRCSAVPLRLRVLCGSAVAVLGAL